MNLLVVDNHPTSRKLLRAQLEAEGHTVLEGADGVEALAVLEREHVDGIVSDILMPRMDGYTLCWKIRYHSKFSALPLILYTSTYNSDSDRRLAEDVGADAYIAKPVPTAVLLEALQESMQKAGERKPPQCPLPDEANVVHLYSKVLVYKLEAKNAELQQTLGKLSLAHEKIVELNRDLEQRVQQRSAALIMANEELSYAASHDSLTQLPNRACFLDRLTQCLPSQEDMNNKVAVFFVDLDHFKTVNDGLGHAAGDQLLIGVAQRLLSGVRRQGTSGKLVGSSSSVARLGGDEFAILLDGIRQEGEAAIVAERILKYLSAAFYLDGRKVFTSASIGIAMSSSGITPEDLLRNADTAMYHAKAHGKGHFEIFNEGMRERAIERMEIQRALRQAIESHEFVLHYQPRVSLIGRRIIGFEALVRWNHPTRGLLFPSEFIPVAEEAGLMLPLGRWILREACSQIAVWHKSMIREPALSMSVNVSFTQLAEAGFAPQVERILAETQLDPKALKLEMTESSIMENARMVIAVLRRFKELNIGLELDDFGTGYSSLSYLRQLPFDTVKIDQSFVKELGTADDTSEIIRMIVGLARSLSMDVVAEGVETKDQLARLTAMGCASGQGYYFSKPVDAAAAQRLIRDKDTLQAGIQLKPVPWIGDFEATGTGGLD